jgi:hypothetical protein
VVQIRDKSGIEKAKPAFKIWTSLVYTGQTLFRYRPNLVEIQKKPASEIGQKLLQIETKPGSDKTKLVSIQMTPV